MWCRSTKQRRAAVRRRERCEELRVLPHIGRIDADTEIVTLLSMVACRLNRRAVRRLGFEPAGNQDVMVRYSARATLVQAYAEEVHFIPVPESNALLRLLREQT
jgi:hypothetical protein